MREFVTVARHVSGTNDARPCALTPTCGTLVCAAGLAQLVEQLSCKQQVIGSSPISGSNIGCKATFFGRIRPYVAVYGRVGTLN